MFAPAQLDHSAIRLGKRRAIPDDRTLKLGKYLTVSGLAPPPSIVDWTGNVPAWGAMLNNSLGDCAVAAPGHMVMAWTAAINGTPAVIPDSGILTAYSAISGYNPRNGANDDGCNMLDVLKYWQTTGIGGHHIQAYATIDYTDPDAVRQSTYLLGGTYIGVQLPQSAQGQNEWVLTGDPNSRANQPGSWGGHAIPVLAYDDQGNFYVLTWGSVLKMSVAWYQKYADEAYAALSPDWIASNKVAANGIDMNTLAADLKAVQAA